jgi:phosphate starvation-inducible protein PhoH and related proteins
LAKKPQSKSFHLPKPLTKHQSDLIQSICTKEMTIVTGSAGTGKTYIPAAYAAYYYHVGSVDKIVLVRPNVPLGRGLGFLPGDLSEKLAPWVQPIVSVLEQFLSKGEVDCMVKNGKLLIVAMDTVRGATFDNSFIIIDESQNITTHEMMALVTRVGKDSKLVVDGDTLQSDLKNNEKSGLEYLKYLLEDDNNSELAEKVGQVNFDSSDCVRSEMCRLWLKAFENA